MHELLNNTTLLAMLWIVIIIFGSIPLCILYAIFVAKDLGTQLINSINNIVNCVNKMPSKISVTSVGSDTLRADLGPQIPKSKTVAVDQIPNFKNVKSAGGFGSKVDQ
jgi:hypothetical protein